MIFTFGNARNASERNTTQSQPKIQKKRRRLVSSGITFDLVAERASLVLVENDIVGESVGRRRFLGEGFVRDGGSGEQSSGDAERRSGERGEEGREPAATSVGGAASGAAVKSGLEEAVREGDGGGGTAASGGEGPVENRGGSPSHSVCDCEIQNRTKPNHTRSLFSIGLDVWSLKLLEGFMSVW